MAFKKRMNPKKPKSPWTDQTKVMVVTQYLALGKAPLVEALTGVPRQTIRLWKTQPWWGELVAEIQSEESQERDIKLDKIVNKSLELINDRLENGDVIWDSKLGEACRVPVKLRDISRVTVDMIQKQQEIRDKPYIRNGEEQNTDRLLKLAEQFAQFATAFQKKNEKIIEGEVIDAVHDEREEGYEEGESPLQLTAGTDQEPITTQPSTSGI